MRGSRRFRSCAQGRKQSDEERDNNRSERHEAKDAEVQRRVEGCGGVRAQQHGLQTMADDRRGNHAGRCAHHGNDQALNQ
jgi:hypothetical protein